MLNAHVDAEDAARGGADAVSIRLATEFHILLASMTNSPILVRYVSEVAYRCCLTLSLYSRPHSSECAITEHRAIIAALVKGDEAKVMGLMHSHLDSVATRALVAPTPQRGRDLLDILAPYAEEDGGERVVKMAKVVQGAVGSVTPSFRGDRMSAKPGSRRTVSCSAISEAALRSHPGMTERLRPTPRSRDSPESARRCRSRHPS